MKYDISKSTAPKMPVLGKGTECIKLLLTQVSKDMQSLSFRCFLPFLEHTSAAPNFSTQTSVGRNCVACWPIWWPIQAATKANSLIWWKPFAEISASTMKGNCRNWSAGKSRAKARRGRTDRFGNGSSESSSPTAIRPDYTPRRMST